MMADVDQRVRGALQMCCHHRAPPRRIALFNRID
jgi:hypothetical protein